MGSRGEEERRKCEIDGRERVWDRQNELKICDLQGVQVWNADFKQQMVHQSSLCFNAPRVNYYFNGIKEKVMHQHRPQNQISMVRSFNLLCQTRTSDLKKCVHSVVFNMWRFIPNKEHSRTARIFCFHLKKTAAASYRLCREAYSEHAPWRDTCEWWFRRFKDSDFDTRLEGKLGTWRTVKNSRMWNCKHYWTKMICKHKNNPRSNWALIHKPFIISYERGQRFRRAVDGYHVSWTIGKWKIAKHKCHFARSVQKKSLWHRTTTGNEKRIYFENPERKQSRTDPGAPSTSTARPNRFDRKTMLCVLWNHRGIKIWRNG